MSYAVRGFTDDMIAREMGITRGTVNSYWVRIRGKLGHLSRTELVARFVQFNADLQYQARLAEVDARSATHAASHKELLEKANAEIERLQQLLKSKHRK